MATTDRLFTTVIGRVLVKNSATKALQIPRDAPYGLYEVGLWVSEWFAREPKHEPVYIAYKKERCTPGQATILPMDSTEKKLKLLPGTSIWVCAESNVMLNYSIDKVL